MVDVEDKNEWKECIDIGGVRLPTGYFFGASAATGDLSGRSEQGTVIGSYSGLKGLVELMWKAVWTLSLSALHTFDQCLDIVQGGNEQLVAHSGFPLLNVLDNHDIISMKLYQLMVEHTPEEENQDWTKIEPSVSLLKSPKGGFNMNVSWNRVSPLLRVPSSRSSWKWKGTWTLFFTDRQHRRSDRQLPRHPPHGLEGLPASAVCSAGDRGVRRGGSRGFPEEAGEEQEVLLKRGTSSERTVPRWQVEHMQCEFCFSEDCTNVCLWSTGWEWVVVTCVCR